MLKRFHSSLSMKLAIQHSEKKWLNHYLPLDFFSGGGRTRKYCAVVLLPVANSVRLQDGFSCRTSINFPFALNHGAIQEQCRGRNKTRRFSFLEMNFRLIFGKTHAEIKEKQLALNFFLTEATLKTQIWTAGQSCAHRRPICPVPGP